MYQIVDEGSGGFIHVVVSDETTKIIPIDPANTDYQRYVEWLAADNEPEIV